MNACALLSLTDVLSLVAEDWARRLAAAMAEGWDRARIAELHEEVCRLALDADAVGDHRIADGAAELTAYLCCFVDDPIEPKVAQKARLLRLARALGESIEVPAPIRVVGDDRFDEIG